MTSPWVFATFLARFLPLRGEMCAVVRFRRLNKEQGVSVSRTVSGFVLQSFFSIDTLRSLDDGITEPSGVIHVQNTNAWFVL